MESPVGLLKELFALTIIMGMTTHVKDYLDDKEKETFTREDIADALIYASDQMMTIMARAEKDAQEYNKKREEGKKDDNASNLFIDKSGNIKES